jgi:hypothetical protein
MCGCVCSVRALALCVVTLESAKCDRQYHLYACAESRIPVCGPSLRRLHTLPCVRRMPKCGSTQPERILKSEPLTWRQHAKQVSASTLGLMLCPVTVSLLVLQCNSANLRVRTHFSYVERYYKAARELIPLGLVSFSPLAHLTCKVK